jgi:hypothetical protein
VDAMRRRIIAAWRCCRQISACCCDSKVLELSEFLAGIEVAAFYGILAVLMVPGVPIYGSILVQRKNSEILFFFSNYCKYGTCENSILRCPVLRTRLLSRCL